MQTNLPSFASANLSAKRRFLPLHEKLKLLIRLTMAFVDKFDLAFILRLNLQENKKDGQKPVKFAKSTPTR